MDLNKQDEKLLQELLKKYKQGIISGLYPGNNITFTPTGCRDKIISSTSSGTGDGIQSIQEGTNITVDNTDPLNPIISATDSASALFPNGVKLVLSSRDFQADDKDFVLYCPVPSTIITMPTTNPFSEGDYIGVVMSSPDSYFETYNNGSGGTDKMYPFTANPTGTTLEQQSSSEVVILRALNQGTLWILPLCGAVKTSVDINGSNFKTLNRYNYDESQNAIPLSGTEVGKPVTGDIDFANANIIFNNIDGDKFIKFGFNTATDETGLYFDNGLDPQTRFSIYNGDIQCYMPIGSYFSFANDYLGFSNNGNSSFVGIRGGEDYSNIITDLDYTQKIYVDAKASSKQDTLVSGTNIKTINGTTILGSGDIVISASASLSGLTAATTASTLANSTNAITWNWSGLSAGTKGMIFGGTDILVNGITVGLGRYQNASNVALGLNALAASTGCLYNTAIGSNALLNLTVGYANTAIGESALVALTTGLDNIGIGRQALNATNGQENIGIGNFSLTSMGTASGNVAIGKNALYHLNTGNSNVAIGNNALVATKGGNNIGIGHNVGYNLTTGTNNTIVGYYTGLGITTGSKNTIIGANITGLASSLSNTIILADGDGVVRLYCNSAGSTGIGTTTPSASAKLEITSTTQGVLLPRMTTTQKNAISSPAEGLEVYDSTLKKKCFYNGTAWETITSI